MVVYGIVFVWYFYIMIEGCIVVKLVFGKFRIVGYLYDKFVGIKW